MDDTENFLTQVYLNSDRLVNCTLVLLSLMFLWTFINVVKMGVRYGFTTWYSHRFWKAKASLPERGEWASLRQLGWNYRRGHVPAVYFEALREFGRARELVSAKQSVEIANRGASGAANLMYRHLGQGMSTLKTIATTAPFIGLIGTAIRLLDWFGGSEGNGYFHIFLICRITAESLVTTAIGLIVGILAIWWFNLRTNQLGRFIGEREIASLHLMKHLEQHVARENRRASPS
jgi:biopolymer transport protein ExbB/TolQ